MTIIATRAILDAPTYARVRDERLRELIEHKAPRRVELGSYIGLLFESDATVIGQIQEVVHVENKRHPAQIRSEIDEYACLLPGPGLLTATLMVHAGGPAIGATLSSEVHANFGVVSLEIGERSSPCHVLRPDDAGPAAVHYIGFAVGRSAIEALRDGLPAFLCLRSSVESLRSPLAAPLRAALLATLVHHDRASTNIRARSIPQTNTVTSTQKDTQCPTW
ncbi:DUF3501 family protein [Enhygromyxa salina]|uniref:Uncharacterized protein n=1 Tax=Enhygromyxa salina TaxID=215803 RepID=A0A2S9XPP3_9BACT|nr:DUF3501 family protein [Enhygromyxa salina]PRP94837.1 hypothetical protein ENSA7_76600 [Enhygromyxa salina]